MIDNKDTPNNIVKLDNIEETLNILQKWIKGELLAEDIDRAKEALNSVLLDHEFQIKVLLVGIAKRKFSRILRLISLIDNIEDNIIKNERIADASNAELIKMWNIAQSSSIQDLEFMRAVIELGKSIPDVHIHLGESANTVNVFSGLDRESRENVKNFIDNIFKKVINIPKLGEESENE